MNRLTEFEIMIKLLISNSYFINSMTLEKALKELLIRDPFYGIFMLGLNKRIVNGDHEVQTAAVGLSGLNYTLYVHEDFWKKIPPNSSITLTSAKKFTVTKSVTSKSKLVFISLIEASGPLL